MFSKLLDCLYLIKSEAHSHIRKEATEASLRKRQEHEKEVEAKAAAEKAKIQAMHEVAIAIRIAFHVSESNSDPHNIWPGWERAPTKEDLVALTRTYWVKELKPAFQAKFQSQPSLDA